MVGCHFGFQVGLVHEELAKIGFQVGLIIFFVRLVRFLMRLNGVLVPFLLGFL